MNFCTKCQSIYTQPGTCNCYAGASLPPKPVVIPPPYIGDPPNQGTTTTGPLQGTTWIPCPTTTVPYPITGVSVSPQAKLGGGNLTVPYDAQGIAYYLNGERVQSTPTLMQS